MNKRTIKNVLSEYSVHEVETAVLTNYLAHKNIDKSQIINLPPSDKSIRENTSKFNIHNLKELENCLELLIPDEDRKLNGAFFTPNFIVDYIIEEVKPAANDKCIDLSCGCGAFLVGLVSYFRRTTKKAIKEIVSENIFGADILDYNIKRAKLILSIYALENGETLSESDFNLYHTNSLKHDWQEKFDVIVGNPPYVKYQDLDEENRNFLATEWRTLNKGTFNLYFAFFELGHKLLNDTGRLGYITPNNYFTSLSGEPLREFFHAKQCLYKVIDFSHQKVFDAQTYTAVSFINKKVNEAIEFDRIKDEYKPNEFIENLKFTSNAIADLSKKKWRLLKEEEKFNIGVIENSGKKITSLFKISVGIATLKDSLYFLDSMSLKNGYYEKVIDGKAFFIEEGIVRQIYKISDFKKDAKLSENTRRIIFPYHAGTKQAEPYSLEEMRTLFPKCLEYFEYIRDELKTRERKGEIKPFYAYGRSQGITKVGKKILNPTFSKFPKFDIAEDEEAMYCNGYGLFFDKNLKENLFESPEPIQSEDNIKAVQRILNSLLMHYYVSTTSVAIQGGYPCYQKNFIEKFTIPYLTQEEVSFLNKVENQREADEYLLNKYGVEIEAPEGFYACKRN